VVIGAVLLGTASKEVMVVAPILLVAYDRAFLAGSFRSVWRLRGAVHIGACSGWLLLALSQLTTGGEVSGGGGLVGSTVSPGIYLMTQAGVILRYLRLCFIPVGQCLDYDWPLADGWAHAWPAVAAVACLAALTIRLLYTAPRAGFLGLAFFVILAPSSSLAPRPDCAFEHRMYLPLAAVVVAAVLAAIALGRRVPAWTAGRVSAGAMRVASMAVPLVATALLASATLARNRLYASEEAIWLDVLRTRPDNLRAYRNLGNTAIESGRADDALRYAQEILKRLPDFRSESAESILAAASGPDGRRTAHQVFEWANAWNAMGLAHLARSESARAEECFLEAVRLARGNRRGWYNLGAAMSLNGKQDMAERIWLGLVDEDPNDAMTLARLGEAAEARGDTREAIEYYRRVLALDPDEMRATARLARLSDEEVK
jgi:tetratricopeptide (TPR) repeat protein